MISELLQTKMKEGVLSFRCNICGAQGESEVAKLGRETASCAQCGSTMRMRAMIHLLAMELFGESLALPDFPVHPEIKGVGLSDWDGYAIPLKHKLGYENTFYHTEPRLDITDPDPKLHGTLDYIIATDVFEHVNPPVSRAFEGARKLLKPTGVLIFSVPYTKESRTREHFPELHDYTIDKDEKSGEYILRNKTADGRVQEFKDLCFHGGPGHTLELRVFSEAGLVEEFHKAGFRMRIWKEPVWERGLYWENDWGLPMSAKPRKETPAE